VLCDLREYSGVNNTQTRRNDKRPKQKQFRRKSKCHQ